MHNPSLEMDVHPFQAQRILRLFLKILRDFAGGKGVRNRFLLPGGKLTSAKIVLEPAKLVLRISFRGVMRAWKLCQWHNFTE